MPRTARSATSIAVAALLGVLWWASPATAAPPTGDGSAIRAMIAVDARHRRLEVYSAAMARPIDVDVLLPADSSAPRPTLYLLDGSDDGPRDSSWQSKTGVLRFLAGKNVNVVHPVGGAASYYTDWIRPDPTLGVSKWRTFLTAELPPLIDATLHTDGRNAIAGISMSATSVLQLAEWQPARYGAVAAYSGCAQISDPLGYQFVRLVAATMRANPDNMYGPWGDPRWAANDPVLHADRLRGIGLFLFSGTGLPGSHDTELDPHRDHDLSNEIVLGGAIEAATDYCTHRLRARLTALGIPATYDFPPLGTHSWGYWDDAFHASWPVLAAGLGLPAEPNSAEEADTRH
jgi:S-formylglutathione hydrolase FrmB